MIELIFRTFVEKFNNLKQDFVQVEHWEHNQYWNKMRNETADIK